jgi:hypothetical protein
MPRKKKPNEDGKGQPKIARKGLQRSALSSSPDDGAEGPACDARESHALTASAPSPIAAEDGHKNGARTGLACDAPSAASLQETIDRIRYWHRQRCFAMEQRKRNDLALGAFLRTMLGWSKDKPEAERKKIATQAAALLKSKDDHEWSAVIAAARLVRKPFSDIEKRALQEMQSLAETLPVWSSFGAGVRGFGAASLAVIVAEAGNLANYPDKSKLRKRMGIAVLDGVRQGGLPKGSSAEDWIAHGYNLQRRSRLWNIGDALIKGNRDGKYRGAYLRRKEYELAREPDMKPIKAHRRAQRYMEQRLLNDLWRAWRGAIPNMPERAEFHLPRAGQSEAALAPP